MCRVGAPGYCSPILRHWSEEGNTITIRPPPILSSEQKSIASPPFWSCSKICEGKLPTEYGSFVSQ